MEAHRLVLAHGGGFVGRTFRLQTQFPASTHGGATGAARSRMESLAAQLGLLFALMGCANLWVANHFDTDTWVSFKLFGGLGLMLVFVLLQGIYMSRFIKETPEDSQP